MRPVKTILALAVLAAGTARLGKAIELQSETLKAWDAYIEIADSRMQARLEAGRPFLWIDESPERAVRVRAGEIVVQPATGHGTQGVPSGLIHDWIGAVFIPNATIEGLFAVVHDYDRYKEVYSPAVADSKTLSCMETDQRFSMVWQHHILFLNAAMKGEYQAHDTWLDERRGYNVARTIQVREIERYGQAGEQLLPAGQGNGFIWRLHSIARYEERDGGVYLELEAIALSRDIPASLRWMVHPIVNRLSINSLTTTLRQTRDAVAAHASRQESRTLCTWENHGAGHATAAGEK